MSPISTKVATRNVSYSHTPNPNMHRGLFGGGRCISGVGSSSVSAGVGYRNLGKTCYLNAVLQGLGHMPSICAQLACADNGHTLDRCAFCCFCNVLQPLVSQSQRTTVSPLLLLEHLQQFQQSRSEQHCKFEVDRSEDAFECYLRLLELLQQEKGCSAQVCMGLFCGFRTNGLASRVMHACTYSYACVNLIVTYRYLKICRDRAYFTKATVFVHLTGFIQKGKSLAPSSLSCL